jgi:hypothetical protein
LPAPRYVGDVGERHPAVPLYDIHDGFYAVMAPFDLFYIVKRPKVSEGVPGKGRRRKLEYNIPELEVIEV